MWLRFFVTCQGSFPQAGNSGKQKEITCEKDCIKQDSNTQAQHHEITTHKHWTTSPLISMVTVTHMYSRFALDKKSVKCHHSLIITS